MSRRREIALRIRSLDDIAGIMSAMKGLALMETRVLQERVTTQRRLVASIESSAVRFFSWHAELLPSALPASELSILVGSEQGFCGDFNESLLKYPQAVGDDQRGAVFRLFVGRRLANRVDDHEPLIKLPGASVTREVPSVLLRLTQELNRLTSAGVLRGSSVSALYHCDATGGIRRRRLLPLCDLPPQTARPAYPPELNLPASSFLKGLTGHYLYAALNEVLYSSLLAENRQRLAHMDSALKKLDDDGERLRLAYNARRQEDIIEEIELITLSAGG